MKNGCNLLKYLQIKILFDTYSSSMKVYIYLLSLLQTELIY